MLLESILDYVVDKKFIYQLAASLATYSLLRVVLFVQVRKRRFTILREYGIPGPEPRLLDGSLMPYKSSRTPYRVDEEYKKKYGKVYGVFIGDVPDIVISDPELLRKIFFERQSSFKERCHIFLDNPLAKSILFAPFNRWRAMRKIISPAFSTLTMRGQSSTKFIEDTLKLMLDYIEAKFAEKDRISSSDNPTSVTLDFHSLMKATALKLITGLAINLPDVQVSEKDSYVDSLDAFLSQADSGAVIYAIRFPFIARIFDVIAAYIEHGKTMKSIRKRLNKAIDEGLRELDRNSLLEGEPLNNSQQPQLINTLIKAHHEGRLTREEVIGNCEALLFAGYDTTSTTLVYIFWVLGKYPEIQDKLRNELMAHGVESKYLEQVINETMRLYPTVLIFTSRLATENVTIDQLTLPSGATVIYNAWLMHHDPELWPDPMKFDPERFREGVQIHPCAFAPFGLGERKCVGFSLAQLELKMVTCDILCRYRIVTKSPDKLELFNYANVLTKPSEKIQLMLERI